jgi:hypothetical protein
MDDWEIGRAYRVPTRTVNVVLALSRGGSIGKDHVIDLDHLSILGNLSYVIATL